MKHLFGFLVITLLFSFTPPQERRFSNSGVSFTVPSGWKITEEEDLEGKGYYLACEKNGLNSSGLVTVVWVNDSLDLTETAESYVAELKKNYILKKADPKIGPATRATFNGIPAVKIGYTLTLLGVPHQGSIYSFYGPGKSITLLMQEALEDKEENSTGFRQITASFSAR